MADPTSISGLLEWWSDDPAYLYTDGGTTHVANDADAIQQWNGKTGSFNLTQATALNKPKWDALQSTVQFEAWQNEFMNVPAGLTFTTRAATFFIVCELIGLKRSNSSSGAFLDTYHGFFESGNICNLYFNRDQKLNTYDGATVRIVSGLYFTSSLALYQVVMDTGGVTFRLNSATASLATFALQTVTGGRVCGFAAGNEYPLQARVRDIGIYNKALSGAEQTALIAWANSRGTVASWTNHLCVEGDSLTQGVATSMNRNWVRQMGLSSSVKIDNNAESGNGVGSTANSSFTMIIDAPGMTDNLVVGGQTNVFVVDGGTNDINNSQTAAQTITSIKSLLSGRTGYQKKVVFTLTSHGSFFNGTQQTALAQISTSLRSEFDAATLGADCLIDMAADPNIGQSSTLPSAYFYSVDNVHLTNLGHTVKANLAQPFLLPLLGLTASSYTVIGPSAAVKNVASTAFTHALVGSCTCNGTQQFIVTCPANTTATATAPGGTISNNGTGTVTVTPAAGQTGFTFTVTSTTTGAKSIAFTDNQRGMTRPANASITVSPPSAGGSAGMNIGIGIFV